MQNLWGSAGTQSVWVLIWILKRKTQRTGLRDCLQGNSPHWPAHVCGWETLSHSIVTAHQDEIRRDKPSFTCSCSWGIQDKSSIQTVGLPAEIPAPTFTTAGQVVFLAFEMGIIDLLWSWGSSCQHLARVNILSMSKKHVSRCVLVFRITKFWASHCGPDLVSQHVEGEVRRIRHFWQHKFKSSLGHLRCLVSPPGT